ncbi:MAG: hypothetical protein GEU73_04850 [Chloroflexi bacterium]|nr:hypothetical protein [Chloroflexota bacterium]
MSETGALHADELVSLVRELLQLLRGTSIAELEVEWGGGSVRIQRDLARGEAPTTVPTARPASPEERVVVTSAHVGIVHRDNGSFPRVGDSVSEGMTIAEVETLGIRNAVKAPVDGSLADVLVDDRTPVEYGQPLAIIQVSDTASLATGSSEP